MLKESNSPVLVLGSEDSSNKIQILNSPKPTKRNTSINSDEIDSFHGVRERLKRHREEVAGNVTIPEKWGKEELLKDWIDYSVFDRILAAGRIASARESMIADGRRTNSRPLRVESRC